MSLDNQDSSLPAVAMDHEAALRLDECIQRTAGIAGEHLDELLALLAEAKAGQIHEALGFSSWTEYLVDRLKPVTKALDADDRRALAVELYEAGMSVRDISAATGVPRSTVGDQLNRERGEAQVSGTGQVDNGEGSVVVTTGHDGKNYPRKPTPNKSRELTPVQKLVKQAKAIADSMLKVESKLKWLFADALDDAEEDTFAKLVSILDPPYEWLGDQMNRFRADE